MWLYALPYIIIIIIIIIITKITQLNIVVVW